jgi:hypothetical protein
MGNQESPAGLSQFDRANPRMSSYCLRPSAGSRNAAVFVAASEVGYLRPARAIIRRRCSASFHCAFNVHRGLLTRYDEQLPEGCEAVNPLAFNLSIKLTA